MKKESKLSSAEEYNNWIIFYLNYLSPHFSEESFPLFQKKWKSYVNLFEYWKEKKLENEEIAKIIHSLLTTKKVFTSLVKKYEKKVEVNESLIEKELKNLWNNELDKKVIADRQKVQNYLLGQVRKKFPEYPPKELIFIILNFLKEKAAQK